MDLSSLSLLDLAGTLLGFLFTLLIFSYIFLGDNALFRSSIYIFIGVSAGFAAVYALANVIWPQLILPLLSLAQEQAVFSIILGVLALLLFTRISPRLGVLGSIPVGFLVGIGAATAIGGAVLGTLFPQVAATVNRFDREILAQDENLGLGFFNALILLVGVVTVLVYFQFRASSQGNQAGQRSGLVELLASIGHGFIAVTFGALFAGIYASALTALIERLNSIVQFVLQFISPDNLL
jgi:hypothetical protein